MPTLHARTLRRAAELLGGHELLSDHLGVAHSQLALWLKGVACPPADVFLMAADIVLDDEVRSLHRAGR